MWHHLTLINYNITCIGINKFCHLKQIIFVFVFVLQTVNLAKNIDNLAVWEFKPQYIYFSKVNSLFDSSQKFSSHKSGQNKCGFNRERINRTYLSALWRPEKDLPEPRLPMFKSASAFKHQHSYIGTFINQPWASY